jgi:hypothetical protein
VEECKHCGEKRHYVANRWLCRSCHAANARKWRKQNPEKWRTIQARRTNTYLSQVVGITWQDYERLYKEQEGRCKICKKWSERLHIDHNHASGRFRGLLCFSCNAGIGLFGDNVLWLMRAVLYLKGSLGSKELLRGKL